MGSGYFPYDLEGEEKEDVVKALKGLKEIRTRAANNAMCGDDGQFDNSYSDGYSIALVDLALDILCREFELKEVKEYEPEE